MEGIKGREISEWNQTVHYQCPQSFLLALGSSSTQSFAHCFASAAPGGV